MFEYATVTPTSEQRAATWRRLFGTDTLPVLHDRPRLQETRRGSVEAYDLAVEALTGWQLARLAAYVANRTGQLYADVLADVAAGWPLVADGLVVSSAAPDTARPSSILWDLIYQQLSASRWSRWIWRAVAN